MPIAYRRQAPAPSQRPSVPQAAAPWSTQMRRGSGVPMATGMHRPGAEASAQLRQGPVQALSQQTPSTHCWLAHSVLAVQG